MHVLVHSLKLHTNYVVISLSYFNDKCELLS